MNRKHVSLHVSPDSESVVTTFDYGLTRYANKVVGETIVSVAKSGVSMRQGTEALFVQGMKNVVMQNLYNRRFRNTTKSKMSDNYFHYLILANLRYLAFRSRSEDKK